MRDFTEITWYRACDFALLEPEGALFTGAPVFSSVSMALKGKPDIRLLIKRDVVGGRFKQIGEGSFRFCS